MQSLRKKTGAHFFEKPRKKISETRIVFFSMHFFFETCPREDGDGDGNGDGDEDGGEHGVAVEDVEEDEDAGDEDVILQRFTCPRGGKLVDGLRPACS